MVKNRKLLFGMFSLLLTFSLAFIGCSDSSSSSSNDGPRFDGSTLAGTKWVAEQSNVDLSQLGGGSVNMKVTLEFTSDTAGTSTVEITKWNGQWSDEGKKKVEGLMTADNGPFTSTYDATAKTGTCKLKSGTEGTFTTDVAKKELTTTAVDDGQTETTIYKLK